MGHNDHMLTEDDYNAFCLQAGALRACPVHPHILINQEDADAEGRAYAIATNRWKGGALSKIEPRSWKA